MLLCMTLPRTRTWIGRSGGEGHGGGGGCGGMQMIILQQSSSRFSKVKRRAK
jgi:hypothetical protein